MSSQVSKACATAFEIAISVPAQNEIIDKILNRKGNKLPATLTFQLMFTTTTKLYFVHVE